VFQDVRHSARIRIFASAWVMTSPLASSWRRLIYRDLASRFQIGNATVEEAIYVKMTLFDPSLCFWPALAT
jgi:hypothetical protein